MSTPNYYSQMAPFWNWVAKVEQKGPSHPWFERRAKRAANRGETLETGADGMAHFWQFVSKVEEQGPSHPWIKRRAANQAKRNANGGKATQENEKSVPTASTSAEAPKPRRNGPWGRPKTRQQAAKVEMTSPVTSDSEKDIDSEKTLEQLHSEAEKVEVGNEPRGPGARRGGRGGRGGRGQRFGKGRRAGAAPDGLNGVQTVAPVSSENETVRGPGARCGGRGGRGFGRGAGNIAGQGFGGQRGGNRDGNMALLRRMAMRPQGGPAMVPAPGLGGRGRGAGLGQGRGAGFGRGRGAAGFASGMNQHFTGPWGLARPQNGPAGRHQNQAPARAFAGRNKGNRLNKQAGQGRGLQPRRFGPMRGGRKARDGAFIPLVDIFDHAESYMIHVNVPGAKKENIDVNWDAEKSVLRISGQTERPGDEELHKTLALKERKVGAFKRNVRLGGKAGPAQVAVEDITARMEDGILRVRVPKLDAEFVEVKKVDIF